MQLLIRSNNASNPLALDLTNYIDVQAGSGMDPASPSFTDKVFARSLLKEGATLSLEQMTEKELAFPLKLNAPLAGYTNAAANPSFEYDTAGQAPGLWTFSGSPSTFLVENDWASSGAQSLRYTETRNDGPGSHSIQLPAANFVAVTPGDIWSFGAEINALELDSGCGARLRIVFYQSDKSTVVSTVLGAETLTTGVQALSLANQTVPASAAYAQLSLSAVFGSGTVTVDLYLDAVLFVKAATLPAYIDGDSLGCVWNGPSGYSSSTAPGGSSRTARMVQQINQAVTSPGATVSWQDDGTSQATVFDLLSGQFDLAYNYREGQQAWCSGKLRLFSEPLGHTGAPRPYAAASGYGPLLIISPYASSGALAVGPSTQAGVAGWGGAPGAASTGVFYQGSPQLAGDAPALLQVSYLAGASPGANMPVAAVSVLPDQFYSPLRTFDQIAFNGPGGNMIADTTAIGGRYASFASTGRLSLTPVPPGRLPGVRWAGGHRLLAITRASVGTGCLTAVSSSLVRNSTSASVPAVLPTGVGWEICDLGTFSLYGSEYPGQTVDITASAPAGGALDVTALVTLPENATWFLQPQGATQDPPLLLDDVAGGQFNYAGTRLPPPNIGGASAIRITQYSHGLVPRPDPQNGPPIIALVGLMPPPNGASNPRQLTTQGLAQVNVLERTRYILD